MYSYFEYKKVKVDIISCDVCKAKYIRLISKNKRCENCKTVYCVHMLGEILKLSIGDFEELKEKGKLLLTKRLQLKYNLRF